MISRKDHADDPPLGVQSWPAPHDYARRGYLQSSASPAPPALPPVPPSSTGRGSSVVYVSYAAGDDANSGSSPAKALKTIAAGVAAAAELPPPRLVLLQPGLHIVSATVVLGPANSNTSIRSSGGGGGGGGVVTVSGAVHLRRPIWSPVKLKPATAHVLAPGVMLLKTPLPATVSLDVLEAFSNLTTRLVAARFPNGGMREGEHWP